VQRVALPFSPSFNQVPHGGSYDDFQSSKVFRSDLTLDQERSGPPRQLYYVWSARRNGSSLVDADFSPSLRLLKIRVFEVSADGTRRPLKLAGVLINGERLTEPLSGEVCRIGPLDATELNGDGCFGLERLTPAFHVQAVDRVLDWSFHVEDAYVAPTARVIAEFTVGSQLAEDARPFIRNVSRDRLAVAVGSTPQPAALVFRVDAGSSPEPWTIQGVTAEGPLANLVSEITVYHGPQSTPPFTLGRGGWFWAGLTVTPPQAPATGSISLGVQLKRQRDDSPLALTSLPIDVVAIVSPALLVQPDHIRFVQGESDRNFPWKRALLLANTAAVPAEGTVRLEGPDAIQFGLDRGAVALDPSQVAVLSVSYCPSGLGPHAAQIRVASPGVADAVVQLESAGTPPFLGDRFGLYCLTLAPLIIPGH
jgi:hypothetical protein